MSDTSWPGSERLKAWPPPHLYRRRKPELLAFAAEGPEQAQLAGLELLRREFKRLGRKNPADEAEAED